MKKVIADTVFVVQILILFILVFERSIQVPPLLQAVGRLHPLMLHLPIGLLLVATFLIFAQRVFEGQSISDLISFMLHVTALTASFTTIMGLLLSLEGTFGADQLWLHKWMGVALSFLCWSLLMLKDNQGALKISCSAGVIVLIFTGHFGASLTHGEHFVLAPLQPDDAVVARVITDSSTVFSATIESIFESKCYGCHSDRKAKGNLILTSLENIAKGGKGGDLWKPNDAAHSLLVERLSLPLADEHHMPPKDKAQLTEAEIYFISEWIDAGADTEIKLKDLAETDTLKQLASAIIPRYQQRVPDKPRYTFDFAPSEKIMELSRPNRTVFQIAYKEPAVQAEFYLRQHFEKKHLEELSDVREQLVTLNLANMPVEDIDLKTVAKFNNLEALNLNETNIKGNGLRDLASLPHLRFLSLSGTEISVAALRELGDCKSLRKVFIWNTAVKEEDLASLTKEFPHVNWEIGYVPNEDEILKLNLPLLKNKSQVLNQHEKVMLKHNLPGTLIHYSLDGTDPDSINSLVFKDSFDVGYYSRIKTKAFKDGWLSSNLEEFIFFRRGFRPDTAMLLTKPDEKFPGEGAMSLTNETKGPPDFYNLPAWIGFRENDLVANFSFEKNTPTIQNITLSYALNLNTICRPPEEMQVWAGNDFDHLQLIKRVRPTQSDLFPKPRIEGISIDLPSTIFKYYRVVAKPVKEMDAGNGKKRNAWLMVDEIFFN